MRPLNQTRLENLSMEEMELRATLLEYVEAMEYVTGGGSSQQPSDAPRAMMV